MSQLCLLQAGLLELTGKKKKNDINSFVTPKYKRLAIVYFSDVLVH